LGLPGAVMRAARGLAAGWRGLRFRLWTTRLRVSLLRHGGRLTVEAPWRVDFRGAPGLRLTSDEIGRGVFRLRVGRGTRIEPGVRLQVETGADNELDIGERVILQAGTRIWLTGGSIRIGRGTIIRDQTVLKSGGELVVGDYVRIGYSAVIHCHERVELADRSVLADLVVVVDSDHVHDGTEAWVMAQPVLAGPIRVGSNTLVGAQCVITRGAVIGSNAVVAAGAVVRMGDHPDGWLIGGIPARPLRPLDDEATVAAGAEP
jgi:acetyltransferase-like isoleucine patch superfamily enzyme